MDSWANSRNDSAVLLIDAFDDARLTLREILSEGVGRAVDVHEAGDLAEARRQMSVLRSRVGLVIFGPTMFSELQALLEFRELHWGVPFCLLVEQFDDPTTACGYTLDVIGFIHIASTPREVCDAVMCMLSGQVYLPRSVRPYLHSIAGNQAPIYPRRNNKPAPSTTE